MKLIDYKKDVVSCLIPCYNSGKYLDDCLQSIRNQRYKNLQLIFIDDGSLDSTYLRLKEFQKKYSKEFNSIVIEKHAVNKGICAAINTGLKKVKGEYLTWFDSDDVLEENCMESKLLFLQKHIEYACVMGVSNIFEKDDLNKVVGLLGAEKRVGRMFDNYLMQYCSTCPGLNLVRTNLLLEVLPDNGIREDVTEQNWYLMLLIAAAYKVGFIEEKVYNYRINPYSDSHKNKKTTGVEWKKFWDDVDRVRFLSITDCALSYVEKCRAFRLQALNSIVNRIGTIDEEQIHSDKQYVECVVNEFLSNARLIGDAKRKICIWGTSKRQKNMKYLLEKHINIEGYIDSYIENEEEHIYSPRILRENRLFLIIALERHEDILKVLEENGYIDGVDYFYPKATIYDDIVKYKCD